MTDRNEARRLVWTLLLVAGLLAGSPGAHAQSAASRVADSTLTLAPNQALLSSLGIAVTAEPSAAPTLAAGIGFSDDAPQGFRIARSPVGGFAGFEPGQLVHEGALTLARGARSARLEGLVLSRLDGYRLGLGAPDGTLWFTLDNMHFRFELGPEGETLVLYNVDLLLADAPAQALGLPALGGAWIGAAELYLRLHPAGAESLSGPAITFQCSPDFSGNVDVGLVDVSSLSQIGSIEGGRVPMAGAAKLKNVGVAAVEWFDYDDRLQLSPTLAERSRHPFLLLNFYRIAQGRIVQLGRSDVKHAFLAINSAEDSRCTCPSKSDYVLYPFCGDVYGIGNNANQQVLAPRAEVAASTGVWNPVGSHFDVGPSGSGAQDGERSHTGADHQSQLTHRLNVAQSDLQTAGARYFYEAWYIVRGDVDIFNSMGSLEVSPTFDGSWTFPVSAGAEFRNGSIIDRFLAATPNPAAAFKVGSATTLGQAQLGVMVTSLGGGQFHYELALINFDTDRGLGSLQVGKLAGVTVSNLTFADGDGSAGNDWTPSVAGTSVTWSAPAGGTLRIGSLLRFGFDANGPPQSTGPSLALDAAGQGALPAVLNGFTAGSGGGPTRPVNDVFAAASGLSGSSASASGSSVNATKETGEPNHAGTPGGASVWWRWTAPASAQVTVNTFGSAFDTVLAAYQGQQVSALTVVASNNNTSGTQSRITFLAVAGQTYHFAVDGVGGAAGAITLNLALTPPGNDAFANAAVLSGTRASAAGTNTAATKEAGEPDHANTPGGASVWWRWTAPDAPDVPAAGAEVTIDTVGSSFDTVLAVYTGASVAALTLVAADDDAAGTLQSRVSFIAQPKVTYRIAVDGFGAKSEVSTGSVQLSLSIPGNDDFRNAFDLSGLAPRSSGPNVGATKETGEPNHAGNTGGRSIWWRWLAPGNGNALISTVGSDFDTTLAVYAGGSVAGLTLLAENDDAVGLQSRVSVAIEAGVVYQIAVDGFDGAQGTASLALDFTPSGPPPNDSFSQPVLLEGLIPTATGTNAAASRQPGEPRITGNPGGASIWYRWVSPISGTFVFDTLDSDFDTLLAVYVGGSVSTLTEIASNDDDSPGVLQSTVIFEAQRGTTYRIAVDGFNNGTGAAIGVVEIFGFVLDAGPPPNDAFAQAEPLAGKSAAAIATNLNATREPGEPQHGDDAGGSSIWWRWQAPITGQVEIATLGSDFDTTLGVYVGATVGGLTEIASNDDADDDPNLITTQSRVRFRAVAGEIYRIAVDGFGGETGVVVLSLEQVASAGALVPVLDLLLD